MSDSNKSTERASYSRITVRVGELESYITALRAHFKTADAFMVLFQEQNLGWPTAMEKPSPTQATSRTKLERPHLYFTSFLDELTTVRDESVQSADIPEVQQMVIFLAQRIEERNMNSDRSI